MTRRPGRALLVLPVVMVVALVGAGCDQAPPAPARSAASCLAAPLPAGPVDAVPATGSAVGGAGAGGQALPDVALPCFSGGGSARLAALGRPAVINLWASWCTPCRSEIPAIQRYAVRAGTRVTVIGVDTADTRTGGGSTIQDLGVTYPNLYDDRQQLLHGVGRADLPVTLFVDAHGGIRHVYSSGVALTEASLAQLVRTYLGVAP